jgi:hypothetical protein
MSDYPRRSSELEAMFTVRNTIIIAVMQVGVIVVGALGAGLCHQIFTRSGILMPWPAQFFYSYGVAAFLIPLAWGATALVLERSPVLSDNLKNLAFCSGIVILILLIGFVLYADVTPWLHGTWSLASDES